VLATAAAATAAAQPSTQTARQARARSDVRI
jgi:hypothetical protein